MFNHSCPVLRKPSWNTTPSTKDSGPLTPWHNLLRWVLLNPNHLLEVFKHSWPCKWLFSVGREDENQHQWAFSKDRGVGFEAASIRDEGTQSSQRHRRVATAAVIVAFLVFRTSRCFRGEKPHPSLCRRFKFPACWPTPFSAPSPTATPPIPSQSITTTPPLTSPGE